jgi:hypothetical protein
MSFNVTDRVQIEVVVVDDCGLRRFLTWVGGYCSLASFAVENIGASCGTKARNSVLLKGW